MRVMGLDLASVTGYGIMDIETDRRGLPVFNKQAVVNVGTFKALGSVAAKVRYINHQAYWLMRTYQPDVVVLEDIYYNKNMRSFKMLAMFQTAVFVAWLAYSKGLGPSKIVVMNSKHVRKLLGIISKNRESIKMEVCNHINHTIKSELDPSAEGNSDVADAVALCMAYALAPDMSYSFGESSNHESQ